MAIVYVLQHVRELEGGAKDVKFLGVYSSREKAQAATARLCQQPGSNGFHIDEYELDKDQWIEGYLTVSS